MRVLVGCEISGKVRDAFLSRGHDAWSCDKKHSNHPRHITADVLTVLSDGWDLFIAHPECRYLCSSGLHWNGRRMGRAQKTEQALEFVRQLMAAPIKRIAIENPRGCIGTRIRPADQTIQPHQFGDDASKATCLWLTNLPLLVPTLYVEPRYVCGCGWVGKDYRRSSAYGRQCPNCLSARIKPRWANQTDSGQNRLGPSPTRSADRAETYPGIAAAMAAQWGIERIECPPDPYTMMCVLSGRTP